ncbi:MAG: DUF3987 domain-containing protein, partial [Proteobacteria bacterium]|nr:DUF3987 domain-containing protein [Pseudomonadota bacterium]
MPAIQATLGQGPAEASICLNVNDKAKDLDTQSGWPAPDPAALQGFRRPPPALPLEQFGPWAAWLGAAAEGAGAPVDYVAGPLLAAIAALIGTTRAASPGPGWVEPSVLWIGLVGDPSSGKSPGADPVLAPLADLEQ